MAAEVRHGSKSLQDIPTDILVGGRPAGTVHPWTCCRKCTTPCVRAIHTRLIFRLKVLMLSLPHRQEVCTCLLACNRADQAPVLLDYPVLSGGAVGPCLQVDV